MGPQQAVRKCWSGSSAKTKSPRQLSLQCILSTALAQAPRGSASGQGGCCSQAWDVWTNNAASGLCNDPAFGHLCMSLLCTLSISTINARGTRFASGACAGALTLVPGGPPEGTRWGLNLFPWQLELSAVTVVHHRSPIVDEWRGRKELRLLWMAMSRYRSATAHISIYRYRGTSDISLDEGENTIWSAWRFRRDDGSRGKIHRGTDLLACFARSRRTLLVAA